MEVNQERKLLVLICGGEFWEVKTGDRDSHMGIIIIDVAFLVLDDIINGDVFR